MGFGSHITLDLNGCNTNKLKDLELHFELLNTLPKKINMTAITMPYVFPYNGLIPEDKGITGFVVIATSHISIHSFQEKNYCFVDIFSCEEFDTELAIKIILDTFEPTTHTVHIVSRGIDFPRSH